MLYICVHSSNGTVDIKRHNLCLISNVMKEGFDLLTGGPYMVFVMPDVLNDNITLGIVTIQHIIARVLKFIISVCKHS